MIACGPYKNMQDLSEKRQNDIQNDCAVQYL